MIWRARFPRRPPAGRIDGIMYYGGIRTMADLIFYAVDLDTNAQIVVPQADMPPSPPSGAAGGGLSGIYPNPVVAAVPDAALGPNVPVMTAGVLPAVSGALLTDLPVVPIGVPGTCAVGSAILDGAGQVVLTAGSEFPNPVGGGVVAFLVAVGAGTLGVLSVDGGGVGSGGTITVTSSLGVADSGLPIIFSAGYWLSP